MPLPLRKVEPVYVSRGNLPEKFKFQNDLEAEANGSLANVILQLSSLSHHAEEIFSDLVRSATDLSTRSVNLQGRLNRLAVKVSQLDGVHEELDSMQDCLNSKPFQSSTSVDQQVVSRPTMSASMLQKLMSCDRPPPLEKLNVYRDDGKDGLKFYTDPNYFFDLWRQEMLKDTEKAVRKPHKPKSEGGQHRKKRVRQPQNTRENQKYKAIQHGEHIMSPVLSPTDGPQNPKALEIGDGVIYYPSEMPKKNSRPTSMEIKHVSFEDMDDRGDRINSNTKQSTPSSILVGSSGNNSHAGTPSGNGNGRIGRPTNARDTLPPPPPPPVDDTPNGNASGEQIQNNNAHVTYPSVPNSNNPLNHSQIQNGSGTGIRMSMPPPPAEGPIPMMDDNEEELPPPPPIPDQYNEQEGNHKSQSILPPAPNNEDILPPAPPPPLPEDTSDCPVPPPPPPPLMADFHSPVKSPTESANGIAGGVELVKKKKTILPVVVDTRNELLKAIRGGIHLKKVEDTKIPPTKEDKTSTTYCDVASILARRVAVEMSDSDSGSSEYDSDGWDETSA